jgi:hypothetical protein
VPSSHAPTEHTPSRHATSRRSTTPARIAGGLVAALALTGCAAVLMVVADPGWRTALAELDEPTPAPPAADGPVYVLGGSPLRLPFALELPGVPSPTRPLWVSAPDHETHAVLAASGLSCGDALITCVVPDPASTYGEALALRALTAELGSDVEITVVTSTFHVARTRWQLHACAVPVERSGEGDTGPGIVVVAPGAGPTSTDRPQAELLKLINAGLRTSCRLERFTSTFAPFAVSTARFTADGGVR